jgi:uncharacterized membrane protein
MVTTSTAEKSSAHAQRYGRGSLELARVANLSDAVFAIAMTLLAFKVEAPHEVGAAGDLVAVLPQALAFLLSFAVVANFWWHHHRLLARLGAVEPGMIALNLALLGAVALVPFPTELIGRQPHAAPAAVTYLALMLVITALTLLIVRRAEHADLWVDGVSRQERRDSSASWTAMLGVTAAAMLVALWAPIVGLVMLLLTGPVDHLVRRMTANRMTDVAR